MASSSYASTPETTNTNRVCRVILGPCTDGLRDIFRHYVPPPTFPHVIKQKKLNLPRLTTDQRDLILPRHGSYTGAYDDMDISLLYILLRNITSIPPHSNGWSNNPVQSDRNLSANIERVRLIRNKCYGHSTGTSMSNTEFLSTWSAIKSVMVDLDTFLNNGKKYENEVDLLRHESMDPERDFQYEEQLRKQVEEDTKTREIVQNLEKTLEENSETLETLDGRMEETSQKVETLDGRVEETSQKVETLDGRVEETSAIVETLEERLEETSEKVEKLDGKVEETSEKVETLEENLEETSEKVDELDGRMEETSQKVGKLDDKIEKLTKSPIPPNVREQYDIDIQKWREEDKLYCETHSFQSVMKKVRNQPWVTFVGVSGSGKSATAHHIALKLQEEGYEVVPTKDVRKMEDYGDPWNPQVFVIDDVVGVFGLQETELNVLINYKQKITKPCMVRSRTLMTCREAVFNETLPYKPFLTEEETVIRLHSSDHALDDNDKKQILQRYGLNVNLMSPALLKSTSRMFPFLCKLYSKETKFQALGSNFFLNPVQCIIDELNDMKRHNKLNYATLVLCMLNENCLSKDILKDRKNDYFMNMKIDSLENCELESQTDAFKFVKALSVMEGTYTKQSGAQYKFIHDSMFEICAYHYGQQFPDQMLLYMSSSYIANSVKPQTSEPGIAHKVKEKQSDSQSSKGDKSSNDSDRNKESNDKINEREESFDLCIRLREDQYPLLAQRLYRDIQNMELYGVFRNPVLKHSQVCQAFISVLKTKSYTELKSLFLSSHGEVDKIGSKRECVLEDSRERKEWEGQEVLVDQRWKLDDKGEWKYPYNVRVISWVIYYGHHQIIEYIIQQTEHHNETSELCEITGNYPHQSKYGVYICNVQASENNRLVEQCKLLMLSCYSGDVQTVRVLLPVCKKAINGIGQISEGICWEYQTPLTVACEGGHVGIVKELVKAGAHVNLQDRRGDTPLIVACERGHVNVVKELVKAGADVNLQKYDENTPLITACKRGDVNVVKELVKAGAAVNLQDNKRNALLITACERGHVNVVKELVKAGADVNLQHEWRNTPLIAACQEGHVSVVEELVKAGADVNLQDTSICKTTPLIAACQKGHVNVVKELVKAGADVNLQYRWSDTPLIAACIGGHVSVVEELVQAGAVVNLQNDAKDTPLIAACEREHVSMVKELVKAGADVNLQDIRGNTPLIVACKRGDVNVVEELEKAGADVNLQDREGKTPLIAACEWGHVSVVKALVKAGVDINLQDKRLNIPHALKRRHVNAVEVSKVYFLGQGIYRNSPPRAACEEGHASVMEELVKAEADVNLQNERQNIPDAFKRRRVKAVEVVRKVYILGQGIHGNTPLITACEDGHVSVVEELVKAGADINLQDDNENTPLIAACEGGHVSVVEELVKAGTDINLQNKYGNTPLIAAVRECSLSTVKCLVEHGADFVTQVVDFNVSPVYTALILNKPDIVKYLIWKQNKINPGTFTGNVHLFNCLVDIRHAGVKTDSRDDVVMTDRSVWCMDMWGYLWWTIIEGDCDALRHLLCGDLDVNQSIQCYTEYGNMKSDVRSLLYTLIDEFFVSHRTEKVRILLGAGADVNVRVRDRGYDSVFGWRRYREYDSVLDREGVSVLERTRRRVCMYSESKYDKHRVPEYKEVMCEIKKHVRRHSV